jgi:hypothetical protein
VGDPTIMLIFKVMANMGSTEGIVLGGEGAVVHEQQLNILDVADQESLVAGRHHVASLLVGAIANLSQVISPPLDFILLYSAIQLPRNHISRYSTKF